MDDHGMAAGNNQTQKGRLQFRIGDIVCSDMAPDMMDRDQGQPCGQGDTLGKVHAYEDRANQSGGVGHRYRVQVLSG